MSKILVKSILSSKSNDILATESLRQCILLNYIKKQNEQLANELICVTITLANNKCEQLTEENILSDYTNNAEHHLWKNSFYSTIMAMRKVANSDNNASIIHKELLISFIDQSIVFYEKLLAKYEEFIKPIKFSDALYWPLDGTLFSISHCFVGIKLNPFFESGKGKTILRSAQRYFLALGDLFRYKAALSASSQLNKRAKMWYFKAAQSNMLNGRAFNQLGVLATQSRNFLDVLFYYVLALSTKHPFEPTRESLELTCQQIYQIAKINNESSVSNEKSDEEKCKKKKRFSNNVSSQVEEIWILPTKSSIKFTGNNFNQLQDIKEQRKALFNILYLAEILISNIGMENFESLRKYVIRDLWTLVKLKNSVINENSLLKITLIFIFANFYIKTGTSDVSAKIQQEYALRIIIDIFCLVLEIVNENLTKFEENKKFLLMDDTNFVFQRVIPTFCVLNEWIFSPPKIAEELLSKKLESYFQINDSGKNCFLLYSSILNKIRALCNNEQIASFNLKPGKSDQISIFLPELMIASSFQDIFHYPSPTFYLLTNIVPQISSDRKETFTMHCRLNSILLAALKRKKSSESKIVDHLNYLHKFKNGNSWEFKFLVLEYSEDNCNQNNINKEEKSSINELEQNLMEDDELLKKQLIYEDRFISCQKLIIEVYPKYLVPDTNSFIDHLEKIVQLVDSKLFIVLVPTIVVDELCSLSKDIAGKKAIGMLSQKLIATLSPDIGPKSKERNIQMQYVIRQATATVDYLRKAADEKIYNLLTITSNGNILPRISFAHEMLGKHVSQTNDDRILASCIALASKIKNSQTPFQQTSKNSITIKRNVVFLTEDRTLIIKAAAARIPVRNVSLLLEWTGI